MSKQLHGILAPILIPYNEQGGIEPSILKTEIDYLVRKEKVHGLVICGTSVQELPFLSFEERKQLIELTLKTVEGRVPVLAGVFDSSLDGTLRYVDMLNKMNIAAVVVPPIQSVFPGPINNDEILEFYKEIAGRVAKPMLVYNPANVAADMPLKLLSDLAKLENVRYIKETSRNMAKVSKLIASLKDRVGLFTTMDMLLPSLELGGSGGVIPPPASGIAVMVYNSFVAGKFDEAIENQSKFSIFPPSELSGRHLVVTMKEALNLMGIRVGPVRAPFSGLNGDERVALKDSLRKVGLYSSR